MTLQQSIFILLKCDTREFGNGAGLYGNQVDKCWGEDIYIYPMGDYRTKYTTNNDTLGFGFGNYHGNYVY